MQRPPRTLSLEAARRFYDRFGARQDRQGWYEDPALERLIAHGGFGEASAVVELGCGTGRLARGLLADHLPAGATYRGFDASATMVELGRERLRPFGERARVERIAGEPPLPLADGAADRFLSTYVFDLLPPGGIRAFLGEARRLLRPGGRLAAAGIAPGATPLSKVVMALWSALHRLRPALMGGCRPLELAGFLGEGGWEILHRSHVVAWGITSEVVVASPTVASGLGR